MSNKSQKRLGQILVEKGLITQEELDSALTEQESSKEFLGTILVNSSIISDKDLLAVLSEQFNIPWISLTDEYIRWDLVKQFSSSLILEYKCLPVSKTDWAVTFAIVNPLDLWVLKKAEEEARGLKTKFLLVSYSDMEEAIQRYRQYMRRSISKLF